MTVILRFSLVFQGTTIPSFQPMQPGPGSAAPLTSQVAPVPGNKPHVVAPSPPPRGFMPVTNTGVVQGPHPGSLQPPSPTHQAPARASVAAAAPPPTIQTVDTSNVPGNCSFHLCCESFLLLSSIPLLLSSVYLL